MGELRWWRRLVLHRYTMSRALIWHHDAAFRATVSREYALHLHRLGDQVQSHPVDIQFRLVEFKFFIDRDGLCRECFIRFNQLDVRKLHIRFIECFFTAWTGPMPITEGSTPALPLAAIVASGVKPNSSAFSLDMMTNAAAPSLMPDAFPAVTLPSFLNAGRSLPSFSAVVPAFTYSSVSKIIGSPLRCGIAIGTISSVNLPASIAAPLFAEMPLKMHLALHA